MRFLFGFLYVAWGIMKLSYGGWLFGSILLVIGLGILYFAITYATEESNEVQEATTDE